MCGVSSGQARRDPVTLPRVQGVSIPGESAAHARRIGRQWWLIATLTILGMLWAGGPVLLTAARIERLPDPLSLERTPAGGLLLSGSPWIFVGTLAGLSVLIAFVCAWIAGADRSDTTRRRVFAALSAGWPVALSGTALATVVFQTDLAAADRARPAAFALALALFGGSCLAGLAALAVRPRAGRDRGTRDDTGETWQRNAAGVSLASLAIPWLAQTAAFLSALMQKGLALPLGLAAVSSLLLVYRVRHGHPQLLVARDGVSLRLGQRTRVHVATADLIGAAVVDCHPLRDFGGYGLRIGRGGRIGWVSRRGPAVRISRRYGGDVVVSIDDAAGAVTAIDRLKSAAASGADQPVPGQGTTEEATPALPKRRRRAVHRRGRQAA
jgi:hypothetical protein